MSGLYEIDPPLKNEEIFELAEFAKRLGKKVSIPPSDNSRFRDRMKTFIIEHGPTKAVGWGQMNEEVLPDSTPRSTLIEMMRLKLYLCAPAQSFLVVDPYLFPSTPDSSYLSDLLLLLEPVVKLVSDLTVVTKASHNSSLRQSVQTSLLALNTSLTITVKETDAFHDRFWIADGRKGIFVGTSLNGLGKRYALLDFLNEDDAQHITTRVGSLP